jgi:biopolymer transport protein ExbD
MGAKLDTGVGGKRGVPDVNAEPNVIPFIDVMLVLLIIFMVTSPIASVDVKTDMPDSKIISSKRPNKPVWISLLDGKDCNQAVKGSPVQGCPAYFVMEESVSISQIGFKTREALKVANPDHANDEEWLDEQRVYLRASGGTQYKNVVQVMNTLQDSNITKIALVADDKKR